MFVYTYCKCYMHSGIHVKRAIYKPCISIACIFLHWRSNVERKSGVCQEEIHLGEAGARLGYWQMLRRFAVIQFHGLLQHFTLRSYRRSLYLCIQKLWDGMLSSCACQICSFYSCGENDTSLEIKRTGVFFFLFCINNIKQHFCAFKAILILVLFFWK